MNNIFGNTDSNISNILISLADIQVTFVNYKMNLTKVVNSNNIPQINENDGLPAQICQPCLYEANNACFFRIKCQESDKLLRNSLQQNEFKFEDVKNEEILQDSHLESLFDNCNWYVEATLDFVCQRRY